MGSGGSSRASAMVGEMVVGSSRRKVLLIESQAVRNKFDAGPAILIDQICVLVGCDQKAEKRETRRRDAGAGTKFLETLTSVT